MARHPESSPLRSSLIQDALFFGLVASLTYVGGTLPCGRFYYENVDGFFGNSFLRLSYEYVYLYLGFIAHITDRAERAFALGALGRRLLYRVRGLGQASAPSRSLRNRRSGAFFCSQPAARVLTAAATALSRLSSRLET